jgi:hypothetical protein
MESCRMGICLILLRAHIKPKMVTGSEFTPISLSVFLLLSPISRLLLSERQPPRRDLVYITMSGLQRVDSGGIIEMEFLRL